MIDRPLLWQIAFSSIIEIGNVKGFSQLFCPLPPSFITPEVILVAARTPIIPDMAAQARALGPVRGVDVGTLAREDAAGGVAALWALPEVRRRGAASLDGTDGLDELLSLLELYQLAARDDVR